MVSLWPWRRPDSSPASFEKALSAQSKKIAATQLKLDKARSHSRRARVLWTLYFSFVYLVYGIVLLLVVGYKNMGAWEWTGMAGGPLIIYLVRLLTTTYFSLRIDSLETRLKDLQAQRTKTIQKLKDITKYDSTIELLEKYGGERDKPKRRKSHHGEDDETAKNGQAKKGPRHSISVQPGRTNIPIPATANIQRPATAMGTPQDQLPEPFPRLEESPSPSTNPFQRPPSADFASNAGDMPPYPSRYEYRQGPPTWIDRIMDAMLGEDETAPKNRIVLICQRCRLVNGQAPPGVKDLGEIGRWRCMSCGALNGELDEGKRIVREVLGQQTDATTEASSEGSTDAVKIERDDAQSRTTDDEIIEEYKEEVESVPSQPQLRKRNRKSGRNKNQRAD